jgi:hypothetical protein
MPNRKFFLSAILFFLGISSTFALGAYHRRVQAGETYHQFYSFPKGGARPVILKYGEGGFLHKLLSRHALSGTLGLTNIGKPARVRFELDRLPQGLTVHWDNSHTSDFDLPSKTVERLLNTGDSISVHHTYYIGSTLRSRAVIYDGGLRILDAETGKRLLFIPIRITNRAGKETGSPEACHEI